MGCGRINDAPGDIASASTSLQSTTSRPTSATDAVRPKSDNTITITEHIVRDYLIARWGHEIAEDIKPLDIQRWLKSLMLHRTGLDDHFEDAGHYEPHLQGGNAPRQGQQESCAERRDTVQDQLPGHCPFARSNVRHPEILASLLHFTLVLTCAATALRSSELLALRWADIVWDEAKFGCQNAGQKGRTAKPRRKHRTVTFRCILPCAASAGLARGNALP